LSDASGKPVADAILLLRPAAGGRDYTTTTTATGKFAFTDIAGGSYEVSLKTGDN
jgi:Carboxypeptidase regulatory-like domain